MPSLVAMLMPVAYTVRADADAGLAGDGPGAATMIAPGADLATGPASTKQHCPAKT
jgi:hypothetical protein